MLQIAWETMLRVIKDALWWFWEEIILWMWGVILMLVQLAKDIVMWPIKWVYGWIMALLPDPNDAAFTVVLQLGTWMDAWIPFDAIFYACITLIGFKFFLLVVHVVFYILHQVWGST